VVFPIVGNVPPAGINTFHPRHSLNASYSVIDQMLASTNQDVQINRCRPGADYSEDLHPFRQNSGLPVCELQGVRACKAFPRRRQRRKLTERRFIFRRNQVLPRNDSFVRIAPVGKPLARPR
jgi:hypothetical protein